MSAKITVLDPNRHWSEQDFGGEREGKWFCITRYGGFGDMIQTAAIFPAIKKLGFKLCIDTHRHSYEIIKHDPHVDEFFIHEKDQVLNEELGGFWGKLSQCFTRYTNFSETVEKSLLGISTSMMWAWPQKARHLLMDVNYQELMFAVATVPFEMYENYRPFYPSKEETEWCIAEQKKIKEKKVLLWSLTGSAHHKLSPWTDMAAMQLLLAMPDLHIIFTGDEAAGILTGGSWDNEPRITDWTNGDIRKTLAMCEHVDCVVGPETGVLNTAGCLEDVHSILMCSHSNPNKVSREWVNHTDLEPEGLSCYPCHLLHNRHYMDAGSRNCFMIDLREIMVDASEDEEPLMTAACTVAIDADQISNAVIEALR